VLQGSCCTWHPSRRLSVRCWQPQNHTSFFASIPRSMAADPLAEGSQNSCPRVFSCHAMPCASTVRGNPIGISRARAMVGEMGIGADEGLGRAGAMLVKLHAPAARVRIFSTRCFGHGHGPTPSAAWAAAHRCMRPLRLKLTRIHIAWVPAFALSGGRSVNVDVSGVAITRIEDYLDNEAIIGRTDETY